MKYIPTPFSAFKKQAKHWRVSVDIAAAVPFDIAKKAIVSIHLASFPMSLTIVCAERQRSRSLCDVEAPGE